MTGSTVVMAIAVSAVLATAGVARAQDHTAPKVSVLPLSATHRAALQAEMLAVKAGVAGLSGSIAMGEWVATAQSAERIRDSYIMKQKLNSEELEELERALPAEFIAKDSQFHRHADGLAHAALEHNYELEVFYFSKMMEGCGACHERYAAEVLGGFKQGNRNDVGH